MNVRSWILCKAFAFFKFAEKFFGHGKDLFIIHAAKTCCIAFVFYGETFVHQNSGESVFVRTSADKRVSAVIYNSFLSLVIARLIENDAWNSWCMYYKKYSL